MADETERPERDAAPAGADTLPGAEPEPAIEIVEGADTPAPATADTGDGETDESGLPIGVRKRINTLTRRAKEAQEERDQVVALAGNYRTAWQRAQQELQSARTGGFNHEVATVQNDGRRAEADVQRWTDELARAHEQGDPKAISVATASLGAAQIALADARERWARVQHAAQRMHQRPPMQVGPMPGMHVPQQPQAPHGMPQWTAPPPQPVTLTTEAQGWLTKNASWFQQNRRKRQDAMQYAARLEEAGYGPDNPDHYQKLDAYLADLWDDHPRPSASAPARTGGRPGVGGVTRTPNGAGSTNKVAITAAEKLMCERHNIPLEVFAKEKAETQRAGA